MSETITYKTSRLALPEGEGHIIQVYAVNERGVILARANAKLCVDTEHDLLFYQGEEGVKAIEESLKGICEQLVKRPKN